MALDDENHGSAFSVRRKQSSGGGCSFCNRENHPVDRCWEKHPELRPTKFRQKKKDSDFDSDSEDGSDSKISAFSSMGESMPESLCLTVTR